MKVIENIGYRAAAKMVGFPLQAVTSIVLARHLSARDYGIVGYAAIFVTFLAGFNDLGIGSALVQRKELEARVANTARSLRVVLGGMTFCLALPASRLAAAGFGDPVVSTVLVLLSLDFVISSVGFIPSYLMIRGLDYRRWVQPMIAAAVVRTAVACWLAVKGFGFWSIVIAGLASSVTQAAYFVCLDHRKPQFQWDKAVVRQLLSFGVPLFSSGLIVFALFNADNFIVGTVSGAKVLGYYALAFNWGAMACSVVTEVVHSVLFPTFARMQHDRERMRRAYLRVLEQLSVLGMLIYVGLSCCAREFLVIVLGRGGEKWLPACHALQILCVYGVLRLTLEPLGNVLVALGRTRLLFRANLIAACCEIGFLYPALVFGGIAAVALVVTISYAIQWLVYWPMIRDDLNVGIPDLKSVFFPAVAAGVCAWAAGAAVRSALPFGAPAFVLMIVTITAVFVTIQGWLSSWRWLGEWRQVYLAWAARA
jgi:O-antigen/teichoic acid export membrane protein